MQLLRVLRGAPGRHPEWAGVSHAQPRFSSHRRRGNLSTRDT